MIARRHVESAALSELTGASIFCKQEYSSTGSFKERARNALAQLTPEQARQGVITASAGNHALGWRGMAYLPYRGW